VFWWILIQLDWVPMIGLLGFAGCNECNTSQFTPRHFTYLAWHRDKVYRKS
jgi:hypothetical protein